MLVTVNVVELSAELAEDKLLIDFKRANPELSSEELRVKIYTKQDNGDIHYTEEAQEMFNTLYEDYFDLVHKYKA